MSMITLCTILTVQAHCLVLKNWNVEVHEYVRTIQSWKVSEFGSDTFQLLKNYDSLDS